MAGKKIAFFGGTFNPIHNGHLALARYIRDNAIAQEILFSVSPSSPFKHDCSLPPVEEREKLVEEAISGEPGIGITHVERSLPVPSYTVDSLMKLRSENPSNHYVLVMGADNLQGFGKWRSWETIAMEFGVIVYPRPGEKMELPDFLEPYKDNITLLTGAPVTNVSSTEIRERLKKGESVAHLVPYRT